MMRRSHALRKRAAFDWVTILSLKRIELQLSLHKATIQPLGNLSFLEERRRNAGVLLYVQDIIYPLAVTKVYLFVAVGIG